MSQHATELCTLLVGEAYGELAARVFSTLCGHGRLSLPGLSYYAGLKPAQAKYTLALLVQQNLAFWYLPTNDDNTFYEADLVSAYALLQHGKQLELVEHSLGAPAASLLAEAHLAGHTCIGDLRASFIIPHVEATGGVNGLALGTDRESAIGSQPHARGIEGSDATCFYTALQQLCDARYLVLLHESRFRAQADNQREAERLTRIDWGAYGTLKGQEKLRFEDAVKTKLDKWSFGPERDTIDLCKRLKIAPADQNRKKRPFPTDDRKDDTEISKRRLGNDGAVLMNGQSTAYSASRIDELNEHIVCVNYERLTMLVRQEVLVSKVATYTGEVTAKVYSKVLQIMEKDIDDVGGPVLENAHGGEDEGHGPSISTWDVVAECHGLLDLAESIWKVDSSNMNTASSVKTNTRSEGNYEPNEEDSSVETHSTEDDRSETEREAGPKDVNGIYYQCNDIDEAEYTMIRQHLQILAEHQLGFLTYHKRVAPLQESWSVPFTTLIRNLRLLDQFDVTESRYGRSAGRLVRIMHEKGKMDEKSLAAQTLLSQKVLRTSLASMHGSGLLELQEIPRDNNRQPARTMFLWFFDQRRSALHLIDGTYKIMSRLMQRMLFERESAKGVIAKASRSDVVGREQEFLATDELATLHKWKRKEIQIYSELCRLDDFICLMREG